MGAKKGHPAPGAANKRHKPDGASDITKFFDRSGQQAAPVNPQQQQQQPGAKPASPDGGAIAAAVQQAAVAAADRTPGGVANPQPREALPKQLSTLQDIGPADSFAMSQDTDAMQVVWQESPGSSSRPAGRTLSHLAPPGTGPAAAGGSGGSGSAPTELLAIKQRLISAAQRPRNARRPPGAAAPFVAGGVAGGAAASARMLQSEELLEGLLGRQQQAPQAPPARGEPAGQQGSGPGQAGSGAGASGVSGQHRTPGTHLPGILRNRGGTGSAGRHSAGRHTPASSVQFSLSSSTAKKAARRAQAGSSGKKRQAGQKRKALLELLEQVENIVRSSASPEAEAPEGAAREAAGQAGPGACRAAAGQPAGGEAIAEDKENAAAQGAAAARAAAQGAAAAAAAEPMAAADGPTGSQQLMPPPGGVGFCGAPRPPGSSASQQQAPGVQPGQQQSRPADRGQQAAAAARPQQAAPQQQQAAPVPAAPAQQAGAGLTSGGAANAGSGGGNDGSGPGSGGSSGGGFGDDDDEEDALMARLEMELLTQVEARQAAQRAQQAQQAPGRPQAAPPTAQHPAAAPQQQQAGSAGVGAQQAQQGQRPLPRSPYDKQGLPPCPPAAAAAAPAPAPIATANQGSDSSWEDDLDAELLDQFEAAALAERAERGNPPSGGQATAAPAPQGQQVAGTEVAEGGGQPPAGAQPRRPCYPGGREEVHYVIKAIYPETHEQVLLLHNKYQNRDVYAHLHAPWCDLPYRVGDPVNVLAQLDLYEGHYHALLNMEQGMLILHPDVLLSGTRITSSHECPRRSYLDEKVAEDGHNDKAVKGTLTHNLIQAALMEGLRTQQQMKAAAERVVSSATEALLEVDMTEEGAMECLMKAVPGIMRWMHRFLRPDPAPDSLLGAGLDYSSGRDIRRSVAVSEVVDIEESIWSTKYGVKGMIDVSARLTLDDPSQQRQPAPPAAGNRGWVQPAGAAGGQVAPAGQLPGRELAVGPIEIKTGKLHESHRAQVLLYLLLMEERYGRPLDWGMLWYTGQTDPQLVVKRPMDLACLMAVRNRLAAAIARKEMPPLSEEKRQCNWCFQQSNCALAHKAQRGPQAGGPHSFVRPSGDRGGALDRVQEELAGKYERATGHMEAADCEFLKKWEALVTLEEGHSASRRPEIWAMEGHERQALGRCVAGLALTHVDEEQLLYTFARADGGALACSFGEGEMLLLSVEGQHAAVARGFFTTCSATHLTVSLNRPLRKGLLLPGSSQAAAAAAGGTGGQAAAGVGAGGVAFDGSVRWRVDRDDVTSTYVRLRGNLFALFRREFEVIRDPQSNRPTGAGPELPRSLLASRLRRLLVHLDPPQFAVPDPTQPDPTPPGMNGEQHVAVQRVLRARDYTLVLGMPGAGKTTTIVSMVQALVSQGRSVLVTSYTNSAVDNILMKLAREGLPFVRLGRPSGVHPAVRPWLPGGERYPERTTRALAALAASTPVFGATCLGCNHAMLRDKVFDVCIVDEAGQILLPAALGPLLKARSFVLVGDHNQLPPLVASKEADAGGLGESLFKRLSDAHPQSVVQLPVQYRMAADIMLLPNTLIYDHALRCGTDGIAQGTLRLGPNAAASLAAQPAWLQAALDPQRRVVFLDTAQVEGARETVAGDAVSNAGEASLVLRLLRAAVAAGVGQEDLGVISPYRSQVALLDRRARAERLEGVEVLTVDKCQGRDKDCIVLSLVRSNAEGEAGKLLADWRRLNVAITRAKTKLVLLGDASTLKNIELFSRLVKLVQEQGWHLPLPPGALAEVAEAAGAADAAGQGVKMEGVEAEALPPTQLQ